MTRKTLNFAEEYSKIKNFIWKLYQKRKIINENIYLNIKVFLKLKSEIEWII